MGFLNSLVKILSITNKVSTRQTGSDITSSHKSGRADYNLLLKNAVAQLPPEAITIPHVGIIEPFCPYCQVPLKKMPGGKTICKSCGNAIYVAKRPSDNKKALFTAAQRPLLAKLNGQKVRLGKTSEYVRDFKRDLNSFQDLGLTQWRFLGCRDEDADPIERQLDGRIVNIGSEDEKKMLVYLCDPRYRFCALSVISSKKRGD